MILMIVMGTALALSGVAGAYCLGRGHASRDAVLEERRGFEVAVARMQSLKPGMPRLRDAATESVWRIVPPPRMELPMVTARRELADVAARLEGGAR